MLSEIKFENLPSYEIGFERGEAIGKVEGKVEGKAEGKAEGDQKVIKIIKSLLNFFDDEKIHQTTGIDLSIIKNIRDKYIEN